MVGTLVIPCLFSQVSPSTTAAPTAAKRILALPIISSSYASTKIQGGTSNSNQPKVQIVVQELPEEEEETPEEKVIRFSPAPPTVSTATTTARPLQARSSTAAPTYSTRSTSTTEGSPYFPAITNEQQSADDDQHFIKDHHLKNSEDLLLKSHLQEDLKNLEDLRNREKEVEHNM